MSRRILVTSALPYANGHIHLGHLVEYVQTDIWVRFQRLRGNRCVYVCADDTHGTAIMLRARQEGRDEESVIADMSAAHQRDFSGFGISFDHYGSTHCPANRKLCETIWAALRRQGLVHSSEVTQLYDPKTRMFLADRFVQGTCPRCGAADQYGDNCDRCGATYGASELIDPRSAVSGAPPEMKSALHLFVDIEQKHEFLQQWTQTPGVLQVEVANYLKGHFLGEPLHPWDVSRPAPYFGFEIPDSPGNYWYVWFDAPIGYIAATAEWCERLGESLEDWWRSETTEIHHFIGKDITYFHTLFWPAMLQASGFTLPRHIQIHGFLTVNGEKMSKSKGTFVLASTYLEHLEPSYLRYYYGSKLTGRVDDIDLNLEDFMAKVNSDLVGKVVNLASRTARFVQGTGLSLEYPDDEGLFAQAAAQADAIARAYEASDTARAMRQVMALADRANEYIDRKEPWALKKRPEGAAEVQAVCTVGLNLFRQIVIYLSPVLPDLAVQCRKLLGGIPIEKWDDAQTPVLGVRVAPFEHMMTRVDPKRVAAMMSASGDSSPRPTTPKHDSSLASIPRVKAADPGSVPANSEGARPMCTIADFEKIDLRVARVVSAEDVPEAKKLLRLELSLGEGPTRTVFAGIKSAYTPASLVGRLVIVVANLEPRTMKFGVSYGMILAAGEGKPSLFLLSVDDGAAPGQAIH